MMDGMSELRLLGFKDCRIILNIQLLLAQS